MTESASAQSRTNDRIKLKVKYEGIGEDMFRVKMSTKLGRVKTAFCERQGLNPQSVVFKFVANGMRIEDHMTPAYLKAEDGDLIEALEVIQISE